MPQYYNVEQNKNMEEQNVALNNSNFDFFFFRLLDLTFKETNL